ncbi:MAG: alpha/beta fold hydrolase [Lysobacter sp.]
MNSLSYFSTGDGVRVAYRFDGDVGKPVLVLSNSIGTTLHMWDAQIPALTRHFRVLRYDLRGHGSTDVAPGAYSLDRLGRDVLEMLDAVGVERAHFLGLSLGGMVGQWLGVYAPERIERLILSNTSAYLGPTAPWDERIAAVSQATDMQATAQMFLGNWFPAPMLDAGDARVEPFRAMLLATRPQGLAGSYAAVRDMDLRRIDALILAPTLVIAGEYDTVTAASQSVAIAATIPDARLLTLPAVHLANVEFAQEFETAVIEFLLAA